LNFFKSKKHKIIPNAPLIPENDPTTLFISAGMQSLVPYLLGQKHPSGKRLCNIQKCIRTGDIEEVGDETHHTFFEMLGNWSLGDYWKEDAIKFSFEFLTKILKIPKERLAVTVFKTKGTTTDNESPKIWSSSPIKIPKEKIKPLGEKDNWWGPAGETGPCGPDTEIFYWASKKPIPKSFDPKNKNWVEIWNNVFMEFNRKIDKKEENITIYGFYPLKNRNVDTGMGVERTLAILNNLNDNYLTECFKPIIEKIVSIYPYQNKDISIYNSVGPDTKKAMRIIADHIKTSAFIINEGITPSNTEQGYILRRLIRRAIRYSKRLKIEKSLSQLVNPICKIYPEYKLDSKKIIQEIIEEENKFNKTLKKGLKFLRKEFFSQAIKGVDPENLPKGIVIKGNKLIIKGEKVAYFSQSFGFPLELTQEIMKEWGVEFDKQTMKEAQEAFKKHQTLSRTASAGKFKSGLADDSEATTKLHTATHLLLEALRTILKDKNITQKGSNITSDRLRLDFSFARKLTKEELKEIEDLVNAEIQKSCEIIKEEMTPQQAKKKGAVGIFDNKYGEKVSVYSVGDFSKEICAGPHVKNTCELGHFKIKKEESSSSGVRRIKGILE
jgi:alanyl-tRNA synthetase